MKKAVVEQEVKRYFQDLFPNFPVSQQCESIGELEACIARTAAGKTDSKRLYYSGF